MPTTDELMAQQDQAALLEELAATLRGIVGALGEQQRMGLEERLDEPLPSNRRSLSPRRQSLGSTVLGNVQPYDLYPGLAANWTFIYHADGRLDSAWRTGDEGAASINIRWDGVPRVDWVQVARGGRRSELHLVWSGGLVVALTRFYAIAADVSPDEFLGYYFLNASRIMAGTFSASPTADYLAVEFM